MGGSREDDSSARPGESQTQGDAQEATGALAAIGAALGPRADEKRAHARALREESKDDRERSGGGRGRQLERRYSGSAQQECKEMEWEGEVKQEEKKQEKKEKKKVEPEAVVASSVKVSGGRCMYLFYSVQVGKEGFVGNIFPERVSILLVLECL